MAEATPPIIRSESGDLLLFASREDAELATEHYDVRAGEYRFWDSEGQILHPQIREESGLVSLQPTGNYAHAEADLTLRAFAEAVGLDSEPKVGFSELLRSIWSWQTGSE